MYRESLFLPSWIRLKLSRFRRTLALSVWWTTFQQHDVRLLSPVMAMISGIITLRTMPQSWHVWVDEERNRRDHTVTVLNSGPFINVSVLRKKCLGIIHLENRQFAVSSDFGQNDDKLCQRQMRIWVLFWTTSSEIYINLAKHKCLLREKSAMLYLNMIDVL